MDLASVAGSLLPLSLLLAALSAALLVVAEVVVAYLARASP
jgi:hypothetical protein